MRGWEGEFNPQNHFHCSLNQRHLRSAWKYTEICRCVVILILKDISQSHHNKLGEISMQWCDKRGPMMNRFSVSRLAFVYENILIRVEVVTDENKSSDVSRGEWSETSTTVPQIFHSNELISYTTKWFISRFHFHPSSSLLGLLF
jgi:hypothetical protein